MSRRVIWYKYGDVSEERAAPFSGWRSKPIGGKKGSIWGTNDTGSPFREYSGRGVALTTHLLAPDLVCLELLSASQEKANNLKQRSTKKTQFAYDAGHRENLCMVRFHTVYQTAQVEDSED
jgi:hypothetical protein